MLRVTATWFSVLYAMNCASFAAGRVALENDALVLEGRRFHVHGIAYHGPASPCLSARDLPLMSALGANVVRTYSLLPEEDRAFPAMLESTGLYWLAGFPLDGLYDPAQPLDQQKQRILHAFRAYASRFRGKPQLLGFVFGENLTAGFDPLIEEAAAILRDLDPEQPPLLATAVDDASLLARRPAGLSFWLWNAREVSPAALSTAGHTASLPVLVSGYGAEAGDAAPGLLGSVYPAFTGGPAPVFDSQPGGEPGLDTLKPSPVFYALASEWGGRYPAPWGEKRSPRLRSVQDGVASPGSLVHLAGTALLHPGAPYADESWPLHLGTVCLCVGNAPARLSLVSPTDVTAQIPLGVEPGERHAILFRGGAASNPFPLRIVQFSAGTHNGPVLEARLR